MVTQNAEPVPAETLAVVRSAYRALATRDIDALLGLLHEDVIWGEAPNPLIPSAGMRFGVDGVMEWLRVGKATETILAFEPVRFLVDGDTVVVIGWTTIEARPTGRIYDSDFVHLVTVADGRIARFQEFFDTWAAAEAFRA